MDPTTRQSFKRHLQELLTPTQFVRLTKISRMALHNWRRDYGFPTVVIIQRPHAVYLIDPDEVITWIRNRLPHVELKHNTKKLTVALAALEHYVREKRQPHAFVYRPRKSTVQRSFT